MARLADGIEKGIALVKVKPRLDGSDTQRTPRRCTDAHLAIFADNPLLTRLGLLQTRLLLNRNIYFRLEFLDSSLPIPLGFSSSKDGSSRTSFIPSWDISTT